MVDLEEVGPSEGKLKSLWVYWLGLQPFIFSLSSLSRPIPLLLPLFSYKASSFALPHPPYNDLVHPQVPNNDATNHRLKLPNCVSKTRFLEANLAKHRITAKDSCHSHHHPTVPSSTIHSDTPPKRPSRPSCHYKLSYTQPLCLPFPQALPAQRSVLLKSPPAHH